MNVEQDSLPPMEIGDSYENKKIHNNLCNRRVCGCKIMHILAVLATLWCGYRYFTGDISGDFERAKMEQPLFSYVDMESVPCTLGESVPQGACVRVPGFLGISSTTHCLPRFIIVGAQKCGTSALRDHLDEHPWIMSGNHPNEIHFFEKIEQRTAEGDAHACPAKAYIKLFPADRVSFDKTPAYMRSFAAMEKIKEWFPHMKIVVMMRDPVERAYSAFCHSVRHNRLKYFSPAEFKKVFKTDNPEGAVLPRRKYEEVPGTLVTECEPELFELFFSSIKRNNSATPLNRSKIWHSEYLPQVEKILSLFGPENLHVVIQENMFKDTMGTLKELESFVGVDHFDYAPDEPYRHTHTKRPLSQEFRDSMNNYFRPDNRMLQALLKRHYNITLPANWAL